jgi:hypothetical protein
MANPLRRMNVVSEAVGDGLAVFDPQLQQPYVLNATSALVFQHCDGQTTPQQLTELLRQKFNVSPSQAEELLWLALDELEKASLLQAKVATTQAPRAMLTRRQALTAFAAAGLSLALLPLVSPVSVAHAFPVFTTTAPPQMTTTTPPPMTTTTTAAPTTTTTTAPPTFPFTGFFPPVDNPPVVNSVKAGQAIPVKFSLGGDRGLGIIASGFPVSYTIPCDGSAPVSPIEETTGSPSGLSYNAATGQYTYVWKTEKSWAGSCRQFKLRLTDGTDHIANFKFK